MTRPADRVAKPGDPDLDLDVDGLTVTAVVSTDREVLIRMVGGYGWFRKVTGGWFTCLPGDGGGVTEAQVGVWLPEMPGDRFSDYVGQLERWRDGRVPLRMCAAPGKVSMLIADRHEFLMLPRRRAPSEATERDDED